MKNKYEKVKEQKKICNLFLTAVRKYKNHKASTIIETIDQRVFNSLQNESGKFNDSKIEVHFDANNEKRTLKFS